MFQDENPVTIQSEQPALVSQPSIPPTESSDTVSTEDFKQLKQNYETLKQEHINLTTEHVKLKVKYNEKSSELRKERQKRYDAEKKAETLQKLCDSQKAGNLPKRTQNIIVRERLKDKLTESQLDGYLNDAKRSRKYTDKDFSFAEQLRSNY